MTHTQMLMLPLLATLLLTGCADPTPPNPVKATKSESDDFRGRTLAFPGIKRDLPKFSQFVKHGVVLEAGKPGSWEHAGVAVPCLKRVDGRLYMWYQCRVAEEIGLAISDDGLLWTRASEKPILPHGVPGEWDSGSAAAPNVLIDEDGMHMWYDGNAAENDGVALGSHQIGLAHSQDGVNWVKDSANPVFKLGVHPAIDDLAIGGSHTLRYRGLTYFYYDRRGSTARKPFYEVGLAISNDGRNWNRLLRPALAVSASSGFDDVSVDDAHVMARDGYLVMFYEGARAVSKKHPSPYPFPYPFAGKSIGVAFSLDGVNWAKPQKNLVL